ncbi:hypothetical protein [Burkholderia phage BCSR129]|nr:hypothetical protein [Burkholderia phage BCSR129]
MNIKALVTLALENRTPDEKIALACKLIGMNPLAYQHLDNGRKSMTAGNMLRGWLKRDENAAGLLQAECGLTDIELDTAPAEPSVAAHKSQGRTASGVVEQYRSEPVDSNYKRTADGTECIPYGANVLFARGVVGNYA